MTKVKKATPVETEIQRKKVEAKGVLSEVVQEIGSMTPSQTDTKIIEVVGRAVNRAETREDVAKSETQKRVKEEKAKNGTH